MTHPGAELYLDAIALVTERLHDGTTEAWRAKIDEAATTAPAATIVALIELVVDTASIYEQRAVDLVPPGEKAIYYTSTERAALMLPLLAHRVALVDAATDQQ